MKIDALPVNNVVKRNETEVVQKNEVGYKLIGKQRKIAGLTLFQCNKETGEVKPCETVNTVSIQFGLPAYKSSLYTDGDHAYVQALNQTNAERKFRKARLLVK